ncbi:MAG TPA: DHA2 family efflux MFS transporter permease subunit [Xanthobacteraceae bacterium]|nr:DHA2 family efflux MFS transporter permease subunit [Xanthobacteraceae bacterium]
MDQNRLVPLIVAVALFMENMDSTIIATSLPAIAADIGANPLALKLAITSYLLSLAVFIPASGWTADRFGARTVFRAAIAIFVIGSIGCAFANSLTGFVIARIVQGMGGAMMTPVGRLVLVRSIDKRKLVDAMAWVTMPALVGPIIGPPVGGFITTYASWHWIFLINVPIGLIGIVLATRYIEDVRVEGLERFDLVGVVLAGAGVAGLAFGLSVAGLGLVPPVLVASFVAVGAIFMTAYVFHARQTAAPVLDFSLARIPTFRANVIGGSLFRLGIGALSFLLPLMLQLGFDYTPLQSGLVTFTAAVGAFAMKGFAAMIIRRFGFRNILIVNGLLASAFTAACAAFTPATPFFVMIVVLLIGGFFRSLQFTATNTIAYADVDARRMSRATALVSVAQQLSIAAGVAVGALCVELALQIKGGQVITAEDFRPAFLVIGTIAASSAILFWTLPADAGAALANREPIAAPDASDQRVG